MRTRKLSIAALLLAQTYLGVVQADDPAPGDQPVKITLHAQPAPVPALKYRLLPPFNDQIRGNAAVYYGKVTAEQTATFGDRELLDEYERLREAPLAELRDPKAKQVSQSILNMLYLAARCESCDWQIPVRDEPYFTILLPEVQQTRAFARLLATQSRIHVARSEFPEALRAFQSGLALARNTAAGQTLINGLVGAAIQAVICEEIRQFVQQPGAPNLYWALTMLPRPLIDFRRGAEAEEMAFDSTFGEVLDLSAERTAEQWDDTLDRFFAQAVEILGDKSTDAESLADASLGLASDARKHFLESGSSQEVVDKMPDSEAVLRYLVATYEVERDEQLKLFFLPVAQGLPAAETESKKRADARSPVLNKFVQLLIPTAASVLGAPARAQREIDLLRVFEALRMHGAANDGQLPAALTDIKEAPIPNDPVTDSPFEYELNDGVATLRMKPLPGRPSAFEIRMAKP